MKHGDNQLNVVQSHQWANDAFTDTLMSYLNLAIWDHHYMVLQDDAGANKVKVLLLSAKYESCPCMLSPLPSSSNSIGFFHDFIIPAILSFGILCISS